MALQNFYGQIYGAIKADFADRVSFQRQSEGGGIVTDTSDLIVQDKTIKEGFI